MRTNPVISTTLLTHNRIRFTQKAVEAYFCSTCIPFELIIVDNASTDGTRQYLEALDNKYPQIRLIFSDQNLPVGSAFNLGFAASSGTFLHRMDNEILHRSGWDKRVLQCFEYFPTLGQISPLKIPESYLTQTHPIDENFAIAFSIRNAPGGSNVIRRELWDRGLRIREDKWYPGAICEDYWMSQDIVRMGYDFAWFATDEYCVNPGHDPQEMIQDVEYYIQSYMARGNLPVLAQRLKPTGFDLWQYLREEHPTFNVKFDMKGYLNQSLSRTRLAWRDTLNGLRFERQYRPHSAKRKLRISAVIPAYNEDDVIYWTIRNLVNQNIFVDVLDNESTDSTGRIVKEFPKSQVSLSSFDTSGQFNEKVQGEHIQAILHKLEAKSDWVIKNDADEFLEPPFQNMSLRKGIELADRLGFNCIGSRNFTFFPMSDEVSQISGGDVRKCYDYYKIWDQVDRWSPEFHPQHNELWKINAFKCCAGIFYFDPHKVSPFTNIVLFPHLFIIRHYPYRHPERTKNRLLNERRFRMSSWNIENQVSCHYTQYTEDDTFIFNEKKQELQRWSELRKPIFQA
jgi:glycosyltransferase involved in cell wall biosynthesis